jgi:hypothetical protein
MGWDKNIYDFGLADKNKNMIPSNKFFFWNDNNVKA